VVLATGAQVCATSGTAGDQPNVPNTDLAIFAQKGKANRTGTYIR
jgi:hypothetical protein